MFKKSIVLSFFMIPSLIFAQIPPHRIGEICRTDLGWSWAKPPGPPGSECFIIGNCFLVPKMRERSILELFYQTEEQVREDEELGLLIEKIKAKNLETWGQCGTRGTRG